MTKKKRLTSCFSLLTTALCMMATAGSAIANRCDGDDQPNHVVRSIHVKARWLPEINLPLKRGDILTADKLSAARLKVIETINQEKDKYESDLVRIGRLQLDVNFVRSCVQVVPPPTCEKENLTNKCVDVELRTYAVSSNPLFMAATLLPMPRSNRFTFLSEVPRVLRLSDPKFGLTVDRELGVTPDFEISTDLLAAKDIAADEPAKSKPVSLLLKAKGGKSLNKDFYTSNARLSFQLNQPSPHIESLSLDVGFEALREPQLESDILKNAFTIGGQISLNPAWGLLNRAEFAGNYRRSQNRLNAISPPVTTRSTESAFEGRSLLEGRIFNGFTRAGVWMQTVKPKLAAKSYKRIAGLLGYEKEVVLGQHTLGFEVLFGVGKATKDTPEYGRFFGGNMLTDFIYQDISEPDSLSSFPTGPILRSFGKGQAAFQTAGGQRVGFTSYQHLNLTVAIPIPGLSEPLIPDEVVNSSPRTTLRDLIEFAVNSGQEALSSSLQDDGLSAEEADKKAAKMFEEIRPGVKYITDYSKIYAIKPLLMFDQARLRLEDHTGQAKYSIGGGIELTVVLAKFQAGYMRAIDPSPRDSRGNFVLRLVFSNLF